MSILGWRTSFLYRFKQYSFPVCFLLPLHPPFSQRFEQQSSRVCHPPPRCHLTFPPAVSSAPCSSAAIFSTTRPTSSTAWVPLHPSCLCVLRVARRLTPLSLRPRRLCSRRNRSVSPPPHISCSPRHDAVLQLSRHHQPFPVSFEAARPQMRARRVIKR